MEVASEERLQQIMNSEVGDQPAHIQNLMEKYPTAGSVAEAKQIELLLDQYLRGDMSVLSDPNKFNVLQSVMSNAHAADAAMKRADDNLMSTVEQTIHKAESEKPTGDELEREKVKGMKIMEQALSEARAKKSTKAQWLEWQMEHGEKETIAVAGRPEQIRVGDRGIRVVMRPEVLNIMGKRIVLQPGVREVPWIIAVYYREAMEGRHELQAREHAMRLQGHMGQLESGFSRVDEEFGTSHQPLVQY